MSKILRFNILSSLAIILSRLDLFLGCIIHKNILSILAIVSKVWSNTLFRGMVVLIYFLPLLKICFFFMILCRTHFLGIKYFIYILCYLLIYIIIIAIIIWIAWRKTISNNRMGILRFWMIIKILRAIVPNIKIKN